MKLTEIVSGGPGIWLRKDTQDKVTVVGYGRPHVINVAQKSFIAPDKRDERQMHEYPGYEQLTIAPQQTDSDLLYIMGTSHQYFDPSRQVYLQRFAVQFCFLPKRPVSLCL